MLPLLGVTMEEKQFVIMSEWMDDGNIIDFLKDRDVNRLQLVCHYSRLLPFVPTDAFRIFTACRHH